MCQIAWTSSNSNSFVQMNQKLQDEKSAHSITSNGLCCLEQTQLVKIAAFKTKKKLGLLINGSIINYSPNGRFLVQETFPKTLPRFVLILIFLQRWQHRVRNETKHFVSPYLIGPQLLANQHETNQHESAALIGLFHATSSVLLSVESYRNYRKPRQRGVQGYLSSLQRRVNLNEKENNNGTNCAQIVVPCGSDI